MGLILGCHKQGRIAMGSMDEDTFIVTIIIGVVVMVIGLAYIVAPDFMRNMRHALIRPESPKRAPDKVLRRWRILGVILIGIGIFILIFNFTHPENAIYIRPHYHYWR